MTLTRPDPGPAVLDGAVARGLPAPDVLAALRLLARLVAPPRPLRRTDAAAGTGSAP